MERKKERVGRGKEKKQERLMIALRPTHEDIERKEETNRRRSPSRTRENNSSHYRREGYDIAGARRRIKPIPDLSFSLSPSPPSSSSPLQGATDLRATHFGRVSSSRRQGRRRGRRRRRTVKVRVRALALLGRLRPALVSQSVKEERTRIDS